MELEEEADDFEDPKLADDAVELEEEAELTVVATIFKELAVVATGCNDV